MRLGWACFRALVTASCAMRSRCCSISSGSFAARPGGLHVDLHARTRSPQACARFDCRRQILPFERRRPQVHHGAPRLGEAVPRHAARHFQIRCAPASPLRACTWPPHRVARRCPRSPAPGCRGFRAPGARAPPAPARSASGSAAAATDRPPTPPPAAPPGSSGAEPRGIPEPRQHLEIEALLAARPARQFRAHAEAVMPVVQAVEVDHAAACPRPPSRGPTRPNGRSTAPAPARSGECRYSGSARGRRPASRRAVPSSFTGLPLAVICTRCATGASAGGFVRIRIEHRQPAAGGEPQASIAGAYATAGDRISGRALRAAQPVLHPDNSAGPGGCACPR